MACKEEPLANDQSNKFVQLKPIATNGPRIAYHAGTFSFVNEKNFTQNFDCFNA
jgi:hypothetical protein